MNQDIITRLNKIIDNYDRDRARKNLILVRPLKEQLKIVREQPLQNILNPHWNNERTREVIRSYLYGEITTLDNLVHSLRETVDKIQETATQEQELSPNEHTAEIDKKAV